MAKSKSLPLITDFNDIPEEALVPEEEQPYPIPETWKWVRLGSAVDMKIGKTPARAEAKYWNASDYPWVKISDFSDTGTIIDTQEKISSTAFDEVFKGVFVPAGTLLMSFKLSIGKCVILDIPAVHNEAIVSILPQSGIVERDYLFLCLPTVTRFGTQRSAVKGKTLNSKSLNALALPLPPLEVQQQIVDYLKTNLAKINQVTSALEAHLEQSDERKANLIQAAITGHLTQQWLDEHGSSVDDLQITTLGKAFKWSSGGTPSRSKADYYQGTIPWVKSGELPNGTIYSTEEHISDEAIANSSAKIFPKGSVLIAMYGATIGKVGILGMEAATNQAIAAARPSDHTSKEYLFYYLIGNKNKFIELGKGGAQPNISQALIKAFPYRMPPLPEQEEIVRILDEQLARINDADSKVQEALDQLNLMKEQLVSAALAGRFTAVAG